MGLSGKYDFSGIKKSGAATIRAALTGSPVLKFPGIDLLLEFIANWAANKGLIVMNIGGFYVNGELDTIALDKALGRGIDQVDSGKKLTPKQMKEIDDAVIKAADRALPYSRRPY